jgi:hypothetical protein
MTTLARIAAAMALATAACTTQNGGITASGPSSSDIVAIDRAFDLRAGQTARVEGTSLTISFTGVIEDSRCPVDVQCVWAGNGAATLVITDDTGAKSSVVLNTTLAPRFVRLSVYDITLTGLKPDPRQGTPIAQVDYVATLRVTRP